MRVFIAVQMASTLVFIVWLLYVWIRDSKFGSQPGCNHLVKYVLLFANVRATETWLRVLFVIYLVLNSCSMLVNFGAIFMEYLHKRVQEKLQGVVGSGIDAKRAGQGGVREGTTSEIMVRVRVYLSVVYVPRIRSPFRELFFNFQTFLIRPAVYGIATLELIVRSVARCHGIRAHGDFLPGPAQSPHHPAWRRRVGLWADNRSGIDFWESH